VLGGGKVVAQRGESAAQMFLDRAGRDAKNLSGVAGIEVQKQPQGNHLTLPGRQPHQGRHDAGIDRTAGWRRGSWKVRNRGRVWHQHLPAVAPPPGDIRVQRGADHPRCRSRMSANRPPRCPGAGEGFGHQILRPVLVTDTNQDNAKALIPGLPVELCEVQLLGSHTHLTHKHPDAADTARAQSDDAELAADQGARRVPDRTATQRYSRALGVNPQPPSAVWLLVKEVPSQPSKRGLLFAIIRAMSPAWRVRIAVRMIEDALRPYRPRSYRQVWLSATAVPLAVEIVGLGLRLIFHTWPQADPGSQAFPIGYVVLVSGRQSLALRRRRRAISRSTTQTEISAPSTARAW